MEVILLCTKQSLPLNFRFSSPDPTILPIKEIGCDATDEYDDNIVPMRNLIVFLRLCKDDEVCNPKANDMISLVKLHMDPSPTLDKGFANNRQPFAIFFLICKSLNYSNEANNCSIPYFLALIMKLKVYAGMWATQH